MSKTQQLMLLSVVFVLAICEYVQEIKPTIEQVTTNTTNSHNDRSSSEVDWKDEEVTRHLQSTADELALCEFVNSTDILLITGGQLIGWRCHNMQPNSSVCSWEGITCDDMDLVTIWNLNEYDISGTIPHSVGSMTALKELYLGYNNLGGTVPPSIWSNLISMRVLHLGDNSLRGTLPHSPAVFADMVDLNLAFNELNGTISDMSGMFPNLAGLRLQSNGLTGPLPSSLAALTKLTLLMLSHNTLTGLIPTAICNLTMLNILQIATGNSFYCYPPCLALMNIPNEDVTSTLPECPSPTPFPSTSSPTLTIRPSSSAPTLYLPSLDDIALCQFAESAHVLEATYTEVYGWRCNMQNYQPQQPICRATDTSVPETYYAYDSYGDDLVGQDSWEGIMCNEFMTVTRWNLREYELYGTIPASVGHMSGLKTLLLAENFLTGVIPSSLWQNTTSIVRIQLSHNMLTGGLPSSMGNLSNLMHLYVSSNRLTGSIPEALGMSASSLRSLDLRNNSLIGTIPDSLGNLSALSMIDLTGNALTGPIPSSFCSSSSLAIFLVATGNSLTCYPSCLSSGYFEVEDFSEILMPCSVEPSSAPSSSAPTLYLPSLDDIALCQLADATNIVQLYEEIRGWRCDNRNWQPQSAICRFDESEFIASWYGTACNMNLSVTSLSLELGLSGSLPSSLGSVPHLEILHLGGNSLHGEIPRSVWMEGRQLESLVLDGNSLTGTLPSTATQLEHLRYFSASGNNLHGTIPDLLSTFWPSLQHLYLDGNLFTGQIPSSIGRFSALQSISLSDNSLTGSVPDSLCNISTLIHIDIVNGNAFSCYPECLDFGRGQREEEQGEGGVPYCTSTPSSQPTISARPTMLSEFPTVTPTTLYNGGSLESELQAFIGDKIDPYDLALEVSVINDRDSYTEAAAAWNGFVANGLNSGFGKRYESIETWAVGLEYGSHETYSSNFRCSDADIASSIVSALISKTAFFHFCGGKNWSVASDGTLCIGCRSSQMIVSSRRNLAENCNDVPSLNITQFVPNYSCQSNQQYLSIISSAILFENSEVTQASVPTINSVEAIAGRFSVEVSVNITLSTESAGGALYCAAFVQSTVITSDDQVRTAEDMAYFIFNSTDVGSTYIIVLEVSNLIPVTEYSVYCSAQDGQSDVQDGSSLSDILATRVDVTTTCCRLVSIYYYPKSVISTKNLNENMRTTSTLQTVSPTSAYLNAFVFQFHVDSAPTENRVLTVRPRFYYYNASTHSNSSGVVDITASPKAFNFTSSTLDSELYGSFVVNGAVSGLYYVELVLEGSAGDRYEAEMGSFTLSLVYADPPLPTLSSVKFSRSGRALVIFDNPTDYGVSIYADMAQAQFPCALLLSFDGSEDSSCVWVNSSSLMITFKIDGGSALEPGGLVVVKGGVLRSYFCLSMGGLQCGSASYSNNTSTTATILPNVARPTVRLKVDNLVGTCSPITLDPSNSVGSGGRPWKSFLWTVSVVSATPTTDQTASALAMSSYLNSLTIASLSQAINIDPSLHSVGTYRFTLTLYNFLRPASGAYQSRNVQVQLNAPPPLRVSIQGRKDRTASIVEPFSVAAFAAWNYSSTCDLVSYDGYSLVYTWRLYRNYVYVNSQSLSNDPRIFLLEPYTLQVGYSYQVSVEVTVSHELLTTSVSSAKVITVTPTAGKVHAVIAGGEYRVLSSSSDAVFDASNSVDEGIPDGGLDSNILSYRWSCSIYAPSDMFGELCGNNLTSIESSFTIPGGILSSNYTYQVTVLVVSSYQQVRNVTRSASKSIIVDIADGDRALSTSISSLFRKFNANDKLHIDAVVSGNYQVNASWAVVDSSVQELLVQSSTFLTPLAVQFSASEVGGMGIEYPLCIQGGALTGGISYTFQLTVNATGANGNLMSLISTITLTANVPPSSGLIEVFPSSGTDNDLYTLVAAQWTDDTSDYPLLYRFEYYHYGNSTIVLALSPQSELSFALSNLPPGLESYGYRISCGVLVQDLYGGVATASSDVIVLPTDYSSDNWIADALDELREGLVYATNTSDYTSLMQLVQNYMSMFNIANCSGAPDCSSLHRLPCSYTDHTCGACDEGYISIARGDSNIECIPATPSTHVSGISVLALGGSSEKTCPSAVEGLMCSGHGNCVIAGNSTKSCLTSDYYCRVVCMCDEGYAGSSCSLNTSSAMLMDSIVYTICESIAVILERSDLSTYQMQMLTDATVNAFDLDWMLTSSTITHCINTVDLLTELMIQRFGLILPFTTVDHVAMILSMALDIPTLDDNTLKKINKALRAVNQYVQEEMADGEFPYEIITDNIKLSVRAELLSSLRNASYYPPSSTTEELLDVVSPELLFNGAGLTLCPDYSRYVRVFVSTFNNDVYGNQSSSPAFQIGSGLVSDQSGGATDESSYSAFVKYTLLIPFKSPVNWTANYTIPPCRYFDSRVDSYMDCPCNVTALSTDNITLSCLDNGIFCRTMTTNRKLRDNTITVTGSTQSGIFNRFGFQRSPRRRLEFDYTGQEKDSYDSDTRLANYQTFIEAVLDQFVTVSANPSPAEWENSWPLLVGVCALFVLFVIGIVYFSIWDETDRLVTIYQHGKGGGPAELFGAQSRIQLRTQLRAYDTREGSLSLSNVDSDCDAGEWMPNEPVRLQAMSSVSKSGNHRTLRMIDRGFSLHRLDSAKSSKTDVSTPQLSPGKKKHSSFMIKAQIREFFEDVIPASDLIGNHSFVARLYGAMISGHDWIRIFTFPSLRLTRVLRFVKVVLDLLLLLFADCLFYGKLHGTV